MEDRLRAPGHGQQGDAAVVCLGLADDAVMALIDGAARALDARVLIRTVGFVIRGQPQRKVQVVCLACHHCTAVPDMRDVQHLQPPRRGGVPSDRKLTRTRAHVLQCSPTY